MIEEYVEKAWELLKEFNRVTPHLVARRFKITLDIAQRVCHQVWLMQRAEARSSAQELENYGFDAQLQRVTRKNLEKFKGKKRKDK